MSWSVNGELVDETAVREEARMMRPRYQEAVTGMDPIDAEMQLREWARENVIERMLLRQTALADPEPVPAEYIEQALQAARTEAGGRATCGTQNSDEDVERQADLEFRLQRLMQRLQTKIRAPSEKEVAAFYKTNREHFRTPELCSVKHIVKNIPENGDESEANRAIEEAERELQNGAEFEDVANRYSDCAGNGGDLGWFPRGQMVEEFENAVLDLPVGKTTAIFRSPFGFHIARVYGRKPAGVQPLVDVREAVFQTLTEQRQQKALEDYLDELRAKADIKQVKATA